MRLQLRVPVHDKRIGIGSGNTVARRICPLHKMITRIRCGSLRRCRRPLRIDAAALPDTTVFTG
ncbi:hypothetical protein Barb7_02510 [Bacteroidales bacterium Barb7]|nr:hypothetical protein Barb7_02510 [Bacteroidales bacterium Barb7]